MENQFPLALSKKTRSEQKITGKNLVIYYFDAAFQERARLITDERANANL